MQLSINVNFTASAELIAVISAFAKGAPAETGKVKEMKSVAKETSAPAKTEAAKPNANASENVPIDLEKIKEATQSLIKAGKTPLIKKLLEEFKVAKASELEAAQYEPYYSKLIAI